ncbi:MAG TPA: glutamine--tRNA ligase [Gelria sp.]|nr:glutamine--tRNA ligase [Gelria sp.]
MRPLKVVIDNYPEGQVEWLEAKNNPEDPAAGSRKLPFSREIYIEQEDFREDPPKKFFRLVPGGEIRLLSAYIIKCEKVVKDEQGQIIELRCTYDPDSKSGGATAGRKVRGTSHWVSALHAIPAEVRLYDHLFLQEDPEGDETEDFTSNVNPQSLEILTSCMLEPSLADATSGDRYQFMRQGYFCLDPDSTSDKLVFNRIVSLRDTWAKIQKK